jgi:hypothetical protein
LIALTRVAYKNLTVGRIGVTQNRTPCLAVRKK